MKDGRWKMVDDLMDMKLEKVTAGFKLSSKRVL